MRPGDTSPEAWKVYIELQRKLSPAEKLRQAFEWSEVVSQFAERVARTKLGAELFHKVYGEALPDARRLVRHA